MPIETMLRVYFLQNWYACLMTLGAFVRNKSRRSTFWNADLRWWLDRHALGL
jgi:hypothetical protein